MELKKEVNYIITLTGDERQVLKCILLNVKSGNATQLLAEKLLSLLDG